MHHPKSRLFAAALLGAAGLFALVGAAGLFVAVAPAASASEIMKHPINAGYLATTATPFTSAKARLLIPNFVCPPTGSAAPGLFARWEKDAADMAGLSVFGSCTGGSLDYVNAFVALAGESESLSVSLGDTVALSLTHNVATGATQMLARNLGSGETRIVRRKLPGFALNGAMFDLNRGSNPLPSFGQLKFSNLTVDGEPAGTRLENLTRVQMVTLDGHKLANTSPFLRDDTAFNVTFIASE